MQDGTFSKTRNQEIRNLTPCDGVRTACPNIFVKLKEAYHPPLGDSAIVRDYETLRTRREFLYSAFGEDRVLFGSDYPNSYGVATIAEEVGLMKRFFSTKSRESAEKYFWKNAVRIYKLKRT